MREINPGAMIPGYDFRNPSLLVEALTHSSLAHEEKGRKDYERLEFLGDAVLQLVVTEMLMESRPVWKEGRLTDARQNVVNMECLAEVSQALGLPALVEVAPNQGSVRSQRRMWSQLFEAVLGAIFEDAGWEAARAWARPLLEPHLRRLAGQRDPKSRLQEWAQVNRGALPAYVEVERVGPPHAVVFSMVVVIGEERFGPAPGRSKKEAEKAAASLALTLLGVGG